MIVDPKSQSTESVIDSTIVVLGRSLFVCVCVCVCGGGGGELMCSLVHK